ncbi:putative ubiquitin domain-containing protein UBFD1 isoform X9 [Apostichopus japonicus]|uniref:Putative ubiquitin domain-containing protein UBFD1 isoform X9 n=1 Tax=Stichopus japonicus TaxID=307972 RepID=A0A2G8KE84_STIJA|nr:putative ubiquitin domain-containing protein UBFD1 isoform X9 [Apostichopus japonicus]
MVQNNAEEKVFRLPCKNLCSKVVERRQNVERAESYERCQVYAGGSKLDDVLEVNKPVDKKALAEEEKKGATKEPFCKMKLHKKILDKGVPDDAMPGIKGVHERLPSVPVSGMVNKANSKVRLTFKLELDQIWIGTKGHSTRAHRGFTVLDLLGPCAIRECNQRYHSRQVALLLTLGLEVKNVVCSLADVISMTNNNYPF